jgi:large subunit ribosomal protein L18
MLSVNIKKINNRKLRHRRLRGKVKGTAEKPRLFVFRSHKHIYAQLIDDSHGKVLVSASDLGLKVKGKIAAAEAVGQAVAEKAKSAKLDKVVFDRGGYKYHGRVKAVAEAARSAGLIF